MLMEHQASIDLTILSAADIKRNWLSADQKVAVAWVDPMAKRTTKTVVGGGSRPQWHETLIVPLDGDNGSTKDKQLTIEIHSKGPLGDTLLGTVYVPLVELALAGKKEANTTLTYQVLQPSGKRKGNLSFLAKIVKPAKRSALDSPSAPPLFEKLDHHADLDSSSQPFQEASTLYPPADVAYPSVERVDARVSSPYPAYPAPEMASSPLQPYPPASYAAEHNSHWQQPNLPYPAYGMAPHPPQMYPPMNNSYQAPPARHAPPYPPYPDMPYPPPTPQSPKILYPPYPDYPTYAPQYPPYPPYPDYPTYAPPYPPQYPPIQSLPSFVLRHKLIGRAAQGKAMPISTWGHSYCSTNS